MQLPKQSWPDRVGMRLSEVCVPGVRRRALPAFTYKDLHKTAASLSAEVGKLHQKGWVIGDLSGSGVCVADRFVISFVDDDLQNRDPRVQKVPQSRIWRGEYMAPEGQWDSASGRPRISHDTFALAVILFQLLMEGQHPFSGRFTGSGEDPSIEKRIASGLFPYCRNRRVAISAVKGAPAFSSIHPKLQDLFVRCFEQGQFDPDVRPKAKEWVSALEAAEQALIQCAGSSQHWFGSHLAECPWCAHVRQFGKDPFPLLESANISTSTEASEPAPFAPTLTPPQKPAVRLGSRGWIPRLSFLVAAILVAVLIAGTFFSWRDLIRSAMSAPIPSSSAEALLWDVDDFVFDHISTAYGERVANAFRKEVHSRTITYSLPVHSSSLPEIFIFRNDSILGRVSLDGSGGGPQSIELEEYDFQLTFVWNLVPVDVPENYARPRPPDTQLNAEWIETYMRDLLRSRGNPPATVEMFSKDVATRTILFIPKNGGIDVVYQKSYTLGTVQTSAAGKPNSFSISYGTLWPYELN
jgi:serine/threonine protein kinase